MSNWLWQALGVSDDFLKHPAEVHVGFQHPQVLWLGLALLLPVGYFIYRRQLHNLASIPRALRIALTATRVVILALLVIVLAGPYLKLDQENEKKPIVAVLFDHSQSMQLPAGPFESVADITQIARAAGYRDVDGKTSAESRKALNQISRANLARTVAQAHAKTVLEPLAKKYDVRYFSFAKAIDPMGVDSTNLQFPEPPRPGGASTQIGDAVTHVLEEAGGRHVAGLVVFSDGQNTAGLSPAAVAGKAAAGQAPIFAVPVGSKVRLRDVALVDVFTTGLVSVGDTVRVAVTVESQGFDKRPVKVELRDGAKLLDSKDLLLLSTEQQQVELTFVAKEPGARYLTVHIPPLPEEPKDLHGNNADTALVRVSKEKIKVLYVEGLPRWDFRFLKNAMRRDHGLAGRAANDPDIVLEAEWRRRPAKEKTVKGLPATAKELAEYHTVILGDVSPELANTQFIELLKEAVRDKGVGLVVAAGPLHMPHAFLDGLQELLPVQVRTKAAGLEAAAYKAFRIELSSTGAIHEVMRLYDDPGRNQNAWTYMPPFHWCAAADRPAPGATVLAWNPSVSGRYGKLPLIAYHYAGKGKVAFVGTDSTWLWRQNVGDRFFYRFWGQALRLVARQDPADAKKSRLEVRPTRVQVGDQALVELMAFAADGTPVIRKSLVVNLAGPGAPRPLELTADPELKGRYTGKFSAETAGDYRLSFESEGAEKVETQFRVSGSAEEFRHPNVNRADLQKLAEGSGGKLIELPDLAVIPDLLRGEPRLSRVHREMTLWDNLLMLAVLVFVYSLDVGLRRLAGVS